VFVAPRPKKKRPGGPGRFGLLVAVLAYLNFHVAVT
jgi:hypothetical protein